MHTDEGPSTDSCLGDDFRAARCIRLRLIVSQDRTSRGDGRSFFHNHLFRIQIVDDHEVANLGGLCDPGTTESMKGYSERGRGSPPSRKEEDGGSRSAEE